MKVVITILIAASMIYPQTKKQKYNTLYAEIFGNGGFFSLNYEREIFNNFSPRIGVGFISSTSSSNSGEHTDFGILPFAMLNYLIQIRGNNNIELGAGIITTGTKYLPTLSFGYRYSPKDGGFFFKCTFDMLPNTDGYLFPWGGIGIGTRF